jgi:hypothetical protein
MMPRRQEGALLLMVSLLLATLAALAFGINRAGSVELRSINDDYEGRAAAYLAEAGVAAARWSGQVGDCVTRPVGPIALGGGTVTITIRSEDIIDVTATATFNGLTRTVTRNQLALYDLRQTERVDMSDHTIDTTILDPSTGPQDPQEKQQTLRLVSGTSHILMNWNLDEIDDDVLVVSATLNLVPTTASGVVHQVAAHRVTTGWDRSATWIKARPASNWHGGTYTDAMLATAGVGSASANWDLTGLFDGWARTRLLANGVLLRLVEPGQAIAFYSREAPFAAQRPLLRIVRAKKC